MLYIQKEKLFLKESTIDDINIVVLSRVLYIYMCICTVEKSRKVK